jgi:hypothetical protein
VLTVLVEAKERGCSDGLTGMLDIRLCTSAHLSINYIAAISELADQSTRQRLNSTEDSSAVHVAFPQAK